MSHRLIVALAAGLMLSGCGVSTALDTTVQGSLRASSTQGLHKGFVRIHQAIFGYLDRNADKRIDEYEAGPHVPLNVFQKIDHNHDYLLTYREFMDFATDQGIFRGHDNHLKFAKRMRGFLDRVFRSLDADRDGYVSADESAKVRQLGLGFEYDTVKVRLGISEIPAEAYQAADKTGDGRLSAGEFEDLYIDLVVKGLNPAAK